MLPNYQSTLLLISSSERTQFSWGKLCMKATFFSAFLKRPTKSISNKEILGGTTEIHVPDFRYTQKKSDFPVIFPTFKISYLRKNESWNTIWYFCSNLIFQFRARNSTSEGKCNKLFPTFLISSDTYEMFYTWNSILFFEVIRFWTSDKSTSSIHYSWFFFLHFISLEFRYQ